MGGEPLFLDLLRRRAEVQPERIAYRFHAEAGEASCLTYGDLLRRARGLAREALSMGARTGDCVLLIFPPGLEFLVGLFACFAARLVAVPMLPPRREGRHDPSGAIMADCGARLAFSSGSLLGNQRADLTARLASQGLRWILTDADAAAGDDIPLPDPPRGDDLALLQYTSGSTSLPKGVMVRHDALMANMAMIQRAFGNSETSSYVSWVPLHHDMGLFLNALQAFYVGAPCVLMTPVTFLQRPLSWLRAICHYGAEVAGGPNFAYDLCVARFRPEQMEGIDLSSWRVAFNAAEPVRAATIARFSRTFAPYGFSAASHYPCYGMAEATVLVSAGSRGEGARIRAVNRTDLQQGTAVAVTDDSPDAARLVGCGRAVAKCEVAIVDSETAIRLLDGRVGEIWVRGPHVAAGYWKKQQASAETFGATLDGDECDPWLRTGDLGFLDADGNVYVTGRMKDVIIIRGVNHYPQDVERTVQEVHPALRPGYVAAFGIADKGEQERVVVVQEVERNARHALDVETIVADIREAVADAHEIALADVVLVLPGSVPQTSSGKVQRRLTRQLWADGKFSALRLDGQP